MLCIVSSNLYDSYKLGCHGCLMITRSKSIKDRSLSLAFRVLLGAMKRAEFMSKSDFPSLMENNTERILNLPGKMPFFPTRITSPELIKEFLSKLHPITCESELIRLGPESDGGYLIPNDLEGIRACFSPGVSDIAGFELDCAKRGMQVYMADASVEKPPSDHSQFSFIKKFIGATTHGEFISLEDWVNSSIDEKRSDLLLQMDIEGFEYEALLSTPRSLLARFRVIVIEFHDLEFLFSQPMFSIYRQVFEKLLSTHYCMHIHPNNFCSTLKVGDLELLQMAEFTFLRKDRISNPTFASQFPHQLDRDNTSKATCPLPKSFYRCNN